MISSLETYNKENNGLITKDFYFKQDLDYIKKDFPSLPESYLSVIDEYEFRARENDGGLHTCLEKGMLLKALLMKTLDFVEESFLKENDLIPIGNTLKDLICVAGTKTKTFTTGEIILIRNFLTQQASLDNINIISKNITQFLLIEGNVNKLLKALRKEKSFSKDFSLNKEEQLKGKIRNILNALKVENKYHPSWNGDKLMASTTSDIF